MKRELISLFVVLFVTALLPYLVVLAEGQSDFIELESYNHARIAESIRLSEWRTIPAGASVYDVLMSLFVVGEVNQIVVFLVNLLLFIGSMFFTFILLRKSLGVIGVLVLSVLALMTPGVMHALFSVESAVLVLFIGLFGTLLILHTRQEYFFAGAIITSVLGGINIILAMYFLVVLIAISARRKWRECVVGILLFMCGSIIFALLTSAHLPELTTVKMAFWQLAKLFVADFGGSGVSIFLLCLCVVGIVTSWREKEWKWWHVFGLLSIFTSIVVRSLALFGILFVAYFASKGVLHLARQDWKLGMVKKLTFFAIFFGLMFTQIAYSTTVMKGGPNSDLEISMAALRSFANSGAVVLSHPKYGFMIERETGMHALISSDYIFTRRGWAAYATLNEVFISRDLAKTKRLLKVNGVSFIIITREMENGLVWSRQDEGLLFVVQDKETFEKLFENGSVRIWRVRAGNK